MTERPQALAQLARLLGDDSVRSATPEEISIRLRASLDQLVEGLVAEAAQSDDVFDQQSGLAYIDKRLMSLGTVLDDELRGQLSEGARERIARW